MTASPAVLELRQLMEDVETVQAEREAIESEFTSPSQDMGKNVLLYVTLGPRFD